MSTFSIYSDTVLISSDSGISSGRTISTASIAEDHPKSKSASGRKLPIQEKLKKVNIPEVPKDFVASKKKPSQIKSKPQQTQKKVEKLLALMIELKFYRIDKMLCSRSLLTLRSRVKHLYL